MNSPFTAAARSLKEEPERWNVVGGCLSRDCGRLRVCLEYVGTECVGTMYVESALLMTANPWHVWRLSRAANRWLSWSVTEGGS